MKSNDLIDVQAPDRSTEAPSALDALLLLRPVVQQRQVFPEVVVGELVAISSNGQLPLVLFPGQHGSAALPARSVVDLHAMHIGRQVVLSFEGGEGTRPIVMGVVRREEFTLPDAPANVEFEADGARMIVNAREQLVLQCGDASITLDKSGRVVIRGTQVISHASGRNRITGGSVELN